MGRLIVIEGTDGAGKSTQAPMLASELKNMGLDIAEVSFPRYDTTSGKLISEYLSGKFGSTGAETAYGASAIYASDRFASWCTDDWGKAYRNGKTVVATRYTTSNMIYQAAKLEKELQSDYINWLCDFEYGRIGLPRPDITVYLDMPCDAAQRLLSLRYGGDESKKDIHEADVNFLTRCRSAALVAAKLCGWTVINCGENGFPRSVEAIHADITAAVKKELMNI